VILTPLRVFGPVQKNRNYFLESIGRTRANKYPVLNPTVKLPLIISPVFNDYIKGTVRKVCIRKLHLEAPTRIIQCLKRYAVGVLPISIALSRVPALQFSK